MVKSSLWRWLLLLAATPCLMGQVPLRELLTGESPPSENESPLDSETVAEERRELAGHIAELAERIQIADPEDLSLTSALTAELDALERLDWVYAQQLTALARNRSLIRDLEATRQQLGAPSRGEAIEPPPYTLALLDRLRAELEVEGQRTDTVADAVRVAEDGLDQATRQERSARQELEEAQADLAAAGAEAEAILRRRVRASLSAANAAAALKRLRRLELENERAARDLHSDSTELLQLRIAFVRERLVMDRSELDQALVHIDKEVFDLKSDRNTAQLELTTAERRLREVQEHLDAEDAPAPASAEQVVAARMAVLSRQQAAALLGERLVRIEATRGVWRQRYEVLAGAADAEELHAWKQDATATLDELERQRLRESARLAELRRDRQALASQIEVASGPVLTPLREQDRHLRDLIGEYEHDRTTIEAAQQLNRWLLDDIEAHAEELPWTDRVVTTLEKIVEFWGTELFTVEDSSITLATLVVALLLLVLGYWVARFLSRLLGQRVLPRFGLQTGATAALQTLTFYLLLVAITLAALRMVNVPLTVFTFLGGALAIGVGFGSQNIVNNFISGLILLIEQPIKVDDLIEVDGTSGKVEQIGPRSTRVRTFSNIHIIVPNSTFLEKNVINWTLSDNLVRVQVNVGVAYGSPTREVERLLLLALSENPRIIDFPVPEVFFAEFGDNALAFYAHFWIKIASQNDRRRIESDVRFRIDELFRESKIVIAFPQRDVHVDTLKPLDIRVLPPEES